MLGSVMHVNAPYEKEFVFHDGRRAKNLIEFAEILEKLPEEEFHTFITAEKNDFANWVEFVLMDMALSTDLRELSSSSSNVLNSRDSQETSETLKDACIRLIHERIRQERAEENSIPFVDTPIANASFVERPLPREFRPDRKSFSTFLNTLTIPFKRKNTVKRESYEQRMLHPDTFHQNMLHQKSFTRLSERKQHAQELIDRILWTTIYTVLIALIVVLIYFKFIIHR